MNKRSITGGLIYMLGDSIAALISGDFTLIRALGICLIGATIYAFEIQKYFQWITKKTLSLPETKRKIANTFLALIYFNPLWIARHLCFIMLLSGKFEDIRWSLLTTALISFLINIPISAFGNFIIQNKVSSDYRFWASAIFSGLMAIYYSMSLSWF